MQRISAKRIWSSENITRPTFFNLQKRASSSGKVASPPALWSPEQVKSNPLPPLFSPPPPQLQLHSVGTWRKLHQPQKGALRSDALWQAAPRGACKQSSALGGGWEETRRGRSGGARVERSPAPRSGPGFACHPVARPAAENSIITAGDSGDWERKIQDPATLGSACAPAALHPKHTHTHFSPGLGKSPKAAPSAGKRLRAPSAAPPDAPPLLGTHGVLPRLAPCPGAAFHPPGLPFAAGSRRASERAREPASQPARAAAATQLRPCGRQGARRAGTRARGGASPAVARGMPSAQLRGRGGLLLLGVTYSN